MLDSFMIGTCVFNLRSGRNSKLYTSKYVIFSLM